MNTDHLKAFHSVAVQGSFTKAAQELFLTQPAVSLQIQSLETALGVMLFDRSQRRIRLTAEGDVLFSYTKRLFELHNEIQAMFQDLSLLKVGRLRLGASSIMATYYLSKVIGLFNKRYPQIEFTLSIGNSHYVADQILEGDVELGFAPGVHIQAPLQQVFLHREPFVMVVPPDSPLAGRERVSADEIARTPFIIREKGARTRDKVMDWFRLQAGTMPEHTVILSNLEATKQLVRNGYGATALPRIAVDADIRQGNLCAVRVDGFDIFTDYYLLLYSKKKRSRAASLFLSLLYEEGVPVPPDLIPYRTASDE